ncbi:MAG: 16S rRNA (uracil(1498)-N(3))-methyltransferase [Bacteroidales bacterium]
MHIFYTPGLISNEYCLNEEESRHCIRVLRLKENDIVYLADGMGTFCEARIVEANPKKCKVIVYQTIKDYNKRNYHLTMAVAPTKQIDRFEWFLEKATEIGVDRVIPFYSHQSERKVTKTERLNKIIESAMKQSKSAYHPQLDEICSFDELMRLNFDSKKFIAHCFDNEKQSLKNLLKKGENVVILIGPEGDFTEGEVFKAKDKGFVDITLGNNRLRTETAALVACHTVALFNQE